MTSEPKEQEGVASLQDRLRDFRSRRSLSQAQAATRLGYPKSTYVAWESGGSEPPAKLLERVGIAFGIEEVLRLIGLPEKAYADRLDGPATRQWALEVEQVYKRSRTPYNSADVIELTVTLLNLPEDRRADCLRVVEKGFRQAHISEARGLAHGSRELHDLEALQRAGMIPDKSESIPDRRKPRLNR